MNQLSRGQIYHKVTILADFILDAIHSDPDRTKGFLCDFDCNIVGGQRKFIDYKFPNVYVTKETILRGRLITGLYRMYCAHKGDDLINFIIDGDQVKIGLYNEDRLADQAIEILNALEMYPQAQSVQQIIQLRQIWKRTQ